MVEMNSATQQIIRHTNQGGRRLCWLALVFHLCLIQGALQAAGPGGIPTVDMAGRKVAVPKTIHRVTSIHSIPSHMLWRLAPEKMVSIDIQFKNRLLVIPDKEAKRLRSLPVTGIYRKGIHREDILVLAPDLILSMSKDPKLDREQRDFAAPIFAISKDHLADYAEAWRLLGQLLGNPKDGAMLSDYWTTTMNRVARVVETIPPENHLKVYYAQRKVTSTVGSKTIMASIIRLAGGVSFLDSMHGSLLQKESESVAVSLEEVIDWNPDVIITASADARKEILSDPRWSSIKAVENGRVHAITRLAMPDRIQSLMGLVWMVNTLHPEAARFDLLAEARHFYKLTCENGHITDKQLRETF